MPHTLEQLRSGQLAGIQRLDLSAGLSEFPPEIFGLADTLEVLNLSNNRLRSLPAELPRLHRLKVLFCSDNPFTTLPEVLGDCPVLEMVGFKANQISQVPAAALPPALRWLILTDNQVAELPHALGERPRLQKLMLAGNRLQQLPNSLAGAPALELLRISANQLTNLPGWLTELPRLAWLAYAGNPLPGADTWPSLPAAPIPWSQLHWGEALGEGASGLIHRADWQQADGSQRPVAVKVFKGAVTSDGLPRHEMAACLAAGDHPQLVGTLGELQGHPDGQPGLVMRCIPAGFSNLAGPPSLASCTRDVYAPDLRFSPHQALHLARGVGAALQHLHQRGVLHGDLYAHNLVWNPQGEVLLGDFGAGAFLPTNPVQSLALQRLEMRALGCLLEELAEHTEAGPITRTLARLAGQCQHPRPAERPALAEVLASLDSLGG